MQTNIPLKEYTTMHLGGPARMLATANSYDELVSFINQATEASLPILVIGEGSNIIVGDEGYKGMVILNRILGYELLSEDVASTVIKVGAGEIWDSVVERTTGVNLSGIENLSAIPGYVGAAPIQNIGAYGQEIADTLIELEAYDLLEKKPVTLKNGDCDFAYRHSIFNSTAKRRYVITSITLQLSKKPLEPPFYKSLQQYLDKNHITDHSPQTLRDAVVTIRATRLPSPKVMANCGSFFKNPMVERWQADNLRDNYDHPPIFAMGDNVFKVSAGWLIEEAGLNGYSSDGMRIYEKNALVLVNESATSYAQLATIRDHIIEVVRDTFRINLVQEPEEIGI